MERYQDWSMTEIVQSRGDLESFARPKGRKLRDEKPKSISVAKLKTLSKPKVFLYVVFID